MLASILSHACSFCVHVLGGHLPTCLPLWREGPARGGGGHRRDARPDAHAGFPDEAKRGSSMLLMQGACAQLRRGAA